MPAPATLKLQDIKDHDAPLYIQFELQPMKSDESGPSGENANEPPTSSVYQDTVTSALMNRKNCYVLPKSTTNHNDVKQFNAIVNTIKEMKCGVTSTSLDAMSSSIQLFSSLLWELDPHYGKLKSRGIHFGAIVEEKFLGFNNPKKHGHSVKPVDMQSLMSKAIHLSVHV